MNNTEEEYRIKMHSFDAALGYDKYLNVLKVKFYIAIVYLIVGGGGNAAIFKVMSDPKFSTKARRILCFSLAITDVMMIIVNFLISTLEMLYGTAVYNIHRILCKVHNPVVYIICHINAWILILLTFERLIAVFRPFNIHDIFSAARVKGIVTTLVVISIIWNGELAYRFDLINEGNSSYCISLHDFNLTKAMFFKDFVGEIFVSVIPILIMVPSNIALIIKMYQNKKQRQQLGVNTSRGQNDSVKFNTMVISVTSAFVILYLPFTLYMFITNYDWSGITDEILFTVAACNHVLNGYLYFLAGDLFKKQVVNDMKRMFECCTCQNPDQNVKDLPIKSVAGNVPQTCTSNEGRHPSSENI